MDANPRSVAVIGLQLNFFQKRSNIEKGKHFFMVTGFGSKQHKTKMLAKALPSQCSRSSATLLALFRILTHTIYTIYTNSELLLIVLTVDMIKWIVI